MATRERGVSFGKNDWLPCSGRAEVCQRTGCQHPATDDTLRLCTVHFAAYQHDSAELVTQRKSEVANRTRPKVRTA
jgi:hypothetical protein